MGKSGSSTKVFSEAWPPLVDRPSSVRFSSARRVKTSMWRASSAACIARTPLMAPRRPPASRLQLIFPETRHRDLLPERLALWFHYIFARGLLGKGGRSSSFVLAFAASYLRSKGKFTPSAHDGRVSNPRLEPAEPGWIHRRWFVWATIMQFIIPAGLFAAFL